MFTPTSTADLPRNWEEAHKFFEGRRNKSNTYRTTSKVNTEVHLRGSCEAGHPIYAIQLYYTDIITYHHDGRVALDPYDSATTDARRNDAGCPVIRGARAMGIPKADRLDQPVRWDFRWFNRQLAKQYPYGVPAVPIVVKDGELVEIDGVDPDHYKEALRVPDTAEQKKRRRVLARTRNLLKDWCRLTEQMDPAVMVRWTFDETDCELLLDRYIPKQGEADAVAEFIDRFVDRSRDWRAEPPTKALEYRLRIFQPAQNKDDRVLWDTVDVKPEELETWLK